MSINELHKAVSDWLNIESPSDEQILEGAGYLREILPYRKGLYNSIVKKPRRCLPMLTELLRRHVSHLAAGLDVVGVAKLDEEVRTTVAAGISSVSEDSLPESDQPAKARGKRADHDQLPEKIQALWTKNAERWKKMASLRATCMGLSAPCDRFELLKELKDNWYAYKKDMKKYDEYQSAPAPAEGE